MAHPRPIQSDSLRSRPTGPLLGTVLGALLCGSVAVSFHPAPGFGVELTAASTAASPVASPQRAGATPRAKRTPPSTLGGQASRGQEQQEPGAAGPSVGSSGGSAPFGSRGDLGGRAFKYPVDNEQRVWFSVADDDSSGWISFREASASMRFDAPRFCVFDTDNDGRFTFPEFSQFIVTEATRGRRLVEPVPPTREEGPRRRSAEQLRAAFDADLDGSISRFEFDAILREYREEAEAFDSEDVFVRLDMDDNKTLEIPELGRLASFLAPPVVGVGGANRGPLPGANTILDLFGQTRDMGEAHPPTIEGPVPPFRRLDLNNDGFVDIADLERLEGRSFNSVRLGSVLNTLDIDDDGRLSEAEFLRSMTPRKQR